MAKIYQVFHYYGVDGGFGDCILKSDIIATFVNPEDAKAFANHFAKPHVYDKPYDYLDCGNLVVVESNIIKPGELNLDEVDTSDFWWLHNEVLE